MISYKLAIIAVIVFTSLASGVVYLLSVRPTNNPVKQTKTQNEEIIESATPTITASPTIKESNIPSINTTKYESVPRVNPEIISLSLKTDINYNQGAMNSLLTSVYNYTNGTCSSIIAEETTQNHIYYMMKSFYDSKVAEYGQYRESIPGVDNSLNAFQNTLQIVKDQCTAAGYQIK